MKNVNLSYSIKFYSFLVFFVPNLYGAAKDNKEFKSVRNNIKTLYYQLLGALTIPFVVLYLDAQTTNDFAFIYSSHYLITCLLCLLYTASITSLIYTINKESANLLHLLNTLTSHKPGKLPLKNLSLYSRK